MAYNFLKNAYYIRNSSLCRYDNNYAYNTSFDSNGDVDGWDVYNNIYFYGCWNGVLFGTSYGKECYVSRNQVFNYVEAESFYYVLIMLKVTDNNQSAAVDTLTTGKIQWETIQDPTWDDNKSETFDLIVDDKWHLYTINLGPSKYWVGEVNNLRVFPFVNGRSGDQFAIKYIKISSLDSWSCSNTSCDYYLNYEHNCPGAGNNGSATASNTKTLYNTVSGVNDVLEISMDGYGQAKFSLGTNTNVLGVDMANIISSKLSTLDIGAYAYSRVEYTDQNKIKIISGNVGSSSEVVVYSTPAAEELGFYENGSEIYTKLLGENPATGFDYASTKLLTSFEINKLINNDKKTIAYKHIPDSYSVEVGRADYSSVGINITSTDSIYDIYNPDNSLSNKGRTIVDWSHPVNNNGILSDIVVFGTRHENPKVLVCRPKLNGTLDIIHTLSFPEQTGFYTASNTTHQMSCNVLVSKGDVLAFYDIDLSVGVSMTGLPDATYSQVSDLPSSNFDPGKAYSYGVGGFIFYGNSGRLQSNTLLDIDLGDRYNISDINVYGEEFSSYFDFNIVSCLDVNWTVDLHGGTHKHSVTSSPNTWVDTHSNVAYGVGCLGDMIRTAENGIAGDTYGRDSTGLWTSGEHSYFYVNGDAEWLQPEEYNSVYDVTVYDFSNDKITFWLSFPQASEIDIYKTKMYFKERKNFRSFVLYYYLGPEGYGGNYSDGRFKLIPSYNYIKLDGINYDPDHEYLKEYLFKNPTSATVTYDRYGVVNNFDHLRAVTRSDWLIIEHGFDPIICKGFGIDCTYHLSTKITELEVYSRMRTDPSLTDNISITYSAYGDIWKQAVFYEDTSTGKVYSNIGGAPRYFTVEFESPVEFNINEIEFLTGKEVKDNTCSSDITLPEAAIGKENVSTKVEIFNMYNNAFDLEVDIPRNFNLDANLLFESTLSSMEDINKPSVGPSCRLYNRDDYQITNYNRQCAINIPCYGLNNLIDDKVAYYSLNGVDWVYYGTLTSGTSLDFCLGDYINTVGTNITFPAVSSTYWKLQLGSYDGCGIIKDIIAYYEGNRVGIEKIYLGQRLGIYTQIDGITSNGTNIDLITEPYMYTFSGVNGSTPDVSYWYTQKTSSAPNYPYIQGNELYFDIPSSSLDQTTQVISYFYLAKDFDIQIDANVLSYDAPSSSTTYPLRFGIWTDSGEYAVVGWAIGSDNVLKWLVYDSEGIWTTNTSTVISASKLRLIRSGATTKAYVWTNNRWEWNGSTSGFTFNFNETKDVFIRLLAQADYDSGVTASMDNLLLNSGTYSNLNINCTTGFKTAESAPIDTLLLIHGNGVITSPQIYTSYTNTNDYLPWKDLIDYTVNNVDHYIHFSVDLINRHGLDIVRNYGDAQNKLWLSLTDNIDYSNSTETSPENVSFANSTKDDVRWLRINMYCSDTTGRCLRKLGVYPDITTIYCQSGGYNCDWTSLGTTLTDYTIPVNLAYGVDVSNTNTYFGTMYPENAVNGDYTEDMASCWGFESGTEAPYFEMLFDSLQTIDKITIYHSYSESDTYYMNTAYSIYYSTTISGSDFVSFINISGNDSNTRTHIFDPIDVRRLKIEITDFTTTEMFIDGEVFLGSFIREIEVFSSVSSAHVHSEEYPIVCLNLKDQFNINSHLLENYLEEDDSKSWDNDDSFFYYADSYTDNPQLVEYSESYDTYYILNSSVSTGDLSGALYEYIIEPNVYITKGIYTVDWQCWDYDSTSDEKISLVIIGNNFEIDLYASVGGDGVWSDQQNVLTIEYSGFYDVKVRQHTDPFYNWGARNVKIYRPTNYGKWVAIKRDTAENYAYGDDSSIYGNDVLDTIKVYCDSEYSITKYPWWWTSQYSNLEYDYIIAKDDGRSLKVSYPSISSADYISYIPGDDFGLDVFWSIKDYLVFWIYIEDISKLDTTYLYVDFGITGTNTNIYYRWDLSSYLLINGWNKVALKFEDYSVLYPIDEALVGYQYIDYSWNLASSAALNRFILHYKGLGEAFNIYITGINIERNLFNENVYFNTGLFLYKHDYLLIPVSGLSLRKGTIEFWFKAYYNSQGIDIFGDVTSRTIFSIVNNNNDIISLGVKSGHWFELVFGHIREDVNLIDTTSYDASLNYFDREAVFHVAVVWDNKAEDIGKGDSIRFYINNNVVYSSDTEWDVGDNKTTSIKLGGGNTPLAYNYDNSDGGGTFENIKIYDFCKTDFSDMNEMSTEKIYEANDFLFISEDNNNFYGKGSSNLPLTFNKVPQGEGVDLYIKTNKDSNFESSNKTADLIITWIASV